MESLVIAFAIGLLVWLMMRRIFQQRIRQRMAAQQAQLEDSGDAPAEQRSMPRIGRPGTVTRAQLAQLRESHFEPSRQWSHEEAQLILDTVAYLRKVVEDQTGDRDPPIEIQNKVLGFILTDEDLRAAVQDSSLNRTREEEALGGLALPDDATHARIAAFVAELWEAETGNK